MPSMLLTFRLRVSEVLFNRSKQAMKAPLKKGIASAIPEYVLRRFSSSLPQGVGVWLVSL